MKALSYSGTAVLRVRIVGWLMTAVIVGSLACIWGY